MCYTLDLTKSVIGFNSVFSMPYLLFKLELNKLQDFISRFYNIFDKVLNTAFKINNHRIKTTELQLVIQYLHLQIRLLI